jgi:osmotically-inducible protein OsmY
MKNDIQLHQDILAELHWDPRLYECVNDIGVETNDGVAKLAGSVSSYVEKVALERAVERVAGVTHVINEVTVSVPVKHARSDTELTERITDALAWDVEVPKNAVTVSVGDGWVTLGGQVEWQYQRDAATRVVRGLIGVRGVTNDIRVAAKPVSSDDVSRTIKEALERRADQTAARIIVDTVDGVVTLTGSVPSFGERRAAEGAAWAAPGVKEVRDALAVVF